MSDLFLESRYTAPRPDCPHPERWHSFDAESCEDEVSRFIGALVTVLQPDLVIETGSGFGQTTREIALALETNGHGSLVTFETDPDRAQRVERMIENMAAQELAAVVQGRLEDWSKDVLEALGRAPQPTRTFAFLDSDPKHRAGEYRWLRRRSVLRPGDIVAVHDAGPQHIVSRDFAQFFEGAYGESADHQLDAIYLPTPRGLLLGECR